MKKFLVSGLFLIVFMFVFTGIPLQMCQFDMTPAAYAMGGHGGKKGPGNNNGIGNGNGNAYGHTKGKGTHGVPDPGTALTLLGIGVAAVGGYSFYRRKKK